ncbi:MAG: hypothetical protein ACRDG2_01870 [Actinomycetota bacterium]
MPDVREIYQMVTTQKPPEPGALERQQRRQVRAARNQKIGAFAVAAAIGVAAIVLFVTTRGDPNTPRSNAPANPSAAKPVEIATDFFEAFDRSDADRAIGLLADTAFPGVVALDTEREFRLLLSVLKAQDYQQQLDSCRELGEFGAGTRVYCTFAYHAIRSSELGLGPYGDSYFDIYVRDGRITRVTLDWNIEEFSPEVWEPFAEWISENHPEDVRVMYVADQADWKLSEAAARLWERRSREYVAELTS